MSDGRKDEATRVVMQEYWMNFKPNNQSMMLDPNADVIGPEEQSEILSYLPELKGKEVLELGAGIGRFSGQLAKFCNHVTVVDFIDEYITENKRRNSAFKNIEFMSADVLELDFPKQTFDLVFSNWLLMYLNDKECVTLVQKVMTWLKPEAFFFVRESCFKPSGGIKRSRNPTFYRSPATYNALLESIRLIPTAGLPEDTFQWQLCVRNVRSLRTYIKVPILFS